MCASETESVLLRARLAELEHEATLLRKLHLSACEERNRLRLALQDVREACQGAAGGLRTAAAISTITAVCHAALGEG
jgi:hypothetical protein